MENDLKVDSMLHRIVGILLDHPRSSWKCIDTNSLIFNNVEVEWLNSSLNTKKINQNVFKPFAMKELIHFLEIIEWTGCKAV